MKSSDDERELLSLIAHELRSPAAVVAGYLRLLRREESGIMEERARHMIEEADRSCGRVLHLVRELGDLAELDGTGVVCSSSAIPVFSLCDEVVRAAVADGASAVFSCAPEDQTTLVHGDTGQLKRAFAALVAAVLRERGTTSLDIYGFVHRDNGASNVVIALGAPGIACRRQNVLVDRGLLFDRWRGGTGLSVPIACRILESYGGRVWPLPQDSRGACALSLPLSVRITGSL